MNLEKIFENKKAARTAKQVFYAAIIIFIALDFVIPKHHVAFPWDSVPGFNAVLGFCASLLIIAVSKALGKIWLQKKENYYDK